MKPSIAFHGQVPLSLRGSLKRPELCSISTTRCVARRSPTMVAVPPDSFPDVAIIGGGAAGLSTALSVALAGGTVTVYSKAPDAAAARAAAGMLLPTCETFSQPALSELAHLARARYPEFVETVQRITGGDVGYVSRGDVLFPLFDGDVAPQSVVRNGKYVNRDGLRLIEPAIGPSITGAYQIPDGGHVDNRILYQALQKACSVLGVSVELGSEVARIVASPDGATVDHLLLTSGERVVAGHYIGAAGAWMKQILPNVPVRPVKGQMLALEPRGSAAELSNLQHLLYGHDCYIVPKQGGKRFFVGATVEEAGFDRETTAGGVSSLLAKAIRAVPSFEDYHLAESWAGLRPATPDLAPIFGLSDFGNMSIATGFYRNGILLMPVASEIAGAVAQGKSESLCPELRRALDHFSHKRFFGSSESSVWSPQVSKTPSGDSTSASTGNVPECTADEPEVLLYHIRADGSKEPVRRGEIPAVFRQGSGDIRGEEEAIRDAAAREGRVLNGAARRPDLESSLNGSAAPATLQKSAVNDAYDDILLLKDKGNVRSSSLAANRSFGVKQRPGVAGGYSSLSSDEVAALDAAFEEGLKASEDVHI